MASVSRSRRTTDERSGGKILRGRRIAAAKTPYDRPVPAEASSRAPPQSPNWLTGFIFPTSRMIATGAAKLLSVLASSSSSSSSSDSEDSSEDFMDDENDSHFPYDGVDEPNKKNETTTQVVECFGKEHQQTLEKSKTKCVIEKLLMQETFSREEGDRLIKIINSRVLNDSAMEERRDGRLDLCNKAVMEAKQWLEDKKVASSSKSDLNLGTCTPNSAVILQVTKGELGSPVDVAKSYMRARPPWASPSINNVESRTPSPIGRELLKEETPYSAAGNSFSSSKKIYSLASGLWNIQEEIRRVRSKATEDMLKTTPSIKTDLSAFSLESKSIQKPLLADKTDLGRGEKVQELDYLPATKSKDASPELPAGVSPHHGIPALEMTRDSSRNEDLSSHPVTFPSAQIKNLEAIRTVEGKEHAASESRYPTIPDVALEHDAISSEKTCSSAKEETELRGNPNANGFPFSGPSFSVVHVEPNPRPADDKNPNPISSNHDKLGNSIPVDETCELLSEASVEVPDGNEINLIPGDSQNSSSLQGEELSQELTQMNPENALTVTGKTNNVVEKKHGRKMSRYNRKSRAKG